MCMDMTTTTSLQYCHASMHPEVPTYITFYVIHVSSIFQKKRVTVENTCTNFTPEYCVVFVPSIQCDRRGQLLNSVGAIN